MRSLLIICSLFTVSTIYSQTFYPVSWQPLEHVYFTEVSNKLVKKTGAEEWGISGGISKNMLSYGLEGEFSFQTTPNFTEKVIGFSHYNNDHDLANVEYGFLVDALNEIHIIEGGGTVTNLGQYNIDDVLGVAVRQNGDVDFILNNSSIYTGSVQVSQDLHVQVILKEDLSELSNVLANFKYLSPVRWSERGNVEVNSEEFSILSNTEATGWDISGASSTNILYPGQSSQLSFTTIDDGLPKAIGYSSENLTLSFSDIEYGFLLDENNEINVLEDGVLVGWYGQYYQGDEFFIEVNELGDIEFIHNGFSLYQTIINPDKRYRIDCAFHEGTASFENVTTTIAPMSIVINTPEEDGVSYAYAATGFEDGESIEFGTIEEFYPTFVLNDTLDTFRLTFYHDENELFFNYYGVMHKDGVLQTTGITVNDGSVTVDGGAMITANNRYLSFEKIATLGSEVLTSICKEDASREYLVVKDYNERGELTVIGTKYYDAFGNNIQSQTREITTKEILGSYTTLYMPYYVDLIEGNTKEIIASNSVVDAWNRPAISSLLAPTYKKNICYQSNFMSNNGQKFNYNHVQNGIHDLGSTKANGTVKGTLGWYYGHDNDEESHVPNSDYPYSKVGYNDYSFTGTDRSWKPSGQAYTDAQKTSRSFNANHHGELQYYFGTIRTYYFQHIPYITSDGYTHYQYSKKVTIDPDGNHTVSFYNKAGNMIASGYAGQLYDESTTTYYNKRELPVSASLRNGYTDVHICKGMEGSLKLSSATKPFQIFNLITRTKVKGTNLSYDITASNLPSLTAGVYRITNKSRYATISYKLNYYDLTLNYYDKGNRVVSNVSPLGIDNAYTNGVDEHNAYKEKAFTEIGGGTSWDFNPPLSNKKRIVVTNLKSVVTDGYDFTNVAVTLDRVNRKYGKPFLGSSSRLVGVLDAPDAQEELNWAEHTLIGTTGFADDMPEFSGRTSNLRTPSYVENRLKYHEAITQPTISDAWDKRDQMIAQQPGDPKPCGQWPYSGGFEVKYSVYSNKTMDANGNFIALPDIVNEKVMYVLKATASGKWVFLENYNVVGTDEYHNQFIINKTDMTGITALYLEVVDVRAISSNSWYSRGNLCIDPKFLPTGTGFTDVDLISLRLGVSQYKVGVKPDHTLASEYQYSSANQLLASETADEGKKEFVYAKDGKLRFSQTAQQKLADEFSYTHYDKYSRVIESGVYNPGPTGTGAVRFQNHEQSHNIGNKTSVLSLTETIGSGGFLAQYCSERAFSEYDLADPNFYTETGLSPNDYKFSYLNGRISKTFAGEMNGTTLNVRTSTWYSYDYQGRLVWMVKLLDGLPDPQTFNYEYDENGLMSQVVFNKTNNQQDLYMKYLHDHAGILKYVETSDDGFSYTQHAAYDYFQHGGLKRVQLGQFLQGIDYVYTIDGKLKTINHPSLSKWNSTAHNFDPGKDGVASTSPVAKDVFGLALDYHKNDYHRKNTFISTKNNLQTEEDFYNGRVRNTRWNQDLLAHNNPSSTGADQWYEGYQYNEKNWLKKALPATFVSFGHENDQYAHWPGGNTGSAQASTIGYSQDSKARLDGVAYDANGNIITLKRYSNSLSGVEESVDNLTYNYPVDANGKRTGNKLDNVDDAVLSNTLTDDMPDQGVNNYEYDADGRMVRDKREHNALYTYDVLGRVTAVYKDNDLAKPMIKNYYDEKGLRYKKESYSETTPGIHTKVEETFYLYNGSNAPVRVFIKDLSLNSTPILNKTYLQGTDCFGEKNEMNGSYNYYIKDHLHSVRAIISQDGDPQTTFSTSYEGTGTDDHLFGTEHVTAYPSSYTTGSMAVRLEGGNTNVNNLPASAIGAGITVPVVNGQTISSSIKHARSLPSSGMGLMHELYDRAHNLIHRVAPGMNNNGSNIMSCTYTVNSTNKGLYLSIRPVVFHAAPEYVDNMTVSLSADGSKKSGRTKVKIEGHQDYYPFGWTVPRRSLNPNSSDKGYQGQFALKDQELSTHHFESRTWDGRLGRWTAPDPASQFASPYLGMANRPQQSVDPNGEFALLAAAGLLLTDAGFDLQKAFSPVALHIDLNIGSHGNGIGADISVGIPQTLPINYRYDLGATYYLNRPGGYGRGWQVRNGGEWGIGLPGFQAQYGGMRYRDWNSSGLQADQVVHTAQIGGPLINVSYTNDTEGSFPWASHVPLIPKLNDGNVPGLGGSDSYRTASGRIRVGLFEAGFFLHTGQADGYERTDINGNGSIEMTGGSIGDPKRSNGIYYGSFAGIKLGWDSETNRHDLQNRFAHDFINEGKNGSSYPWVLRTNRHERFVFQFGDF